MHGERPTRLAGQFALVERATLGLDQLGDAEIEQADLALAGDEDVGRLQVAVNDEVRVRVANRPQHLAEHLDALANRHPRPSHQA